MSIILWIIFGAIVGWIASTIMKGPSGSLLSDVILGIVGAFVGGLIMDMIGNVGVTGFNLYSLIVSVIGAIVLIWIGRRFV